MKRILSLLFMAVIAIGAFAQKDVTTFLGIPVDGFRPAMKQKLIAKGFTPVKVGDEEVFKGEFNGTKVNVYIATNNNKVCRIMLCDANNLSEADIKIRFNKLVSQFENNKRYLASNSYTLSDDEKISYEMIVHNKVYEAVYYQLPVKDKIDTLAMQNEIHEKLLEKYTEEQIANPTEEVTNEMQSIAFQVALSSMYKKPVWFRINKGEYGDFYISMFYDNEYNRANGEDL